MGKLGALDYNDEKIILNHFENETTIKQTFGEDAVRKHLKSDLMVIVKAKDIQQQYRGNYSFIKAKAVLVNDLFGFNGRIEVPCRVACGKLYKLKDSIKGETINILDHLDLLLPNFSCIGIFTFQNGIQNDITDFENMGQKIIDNLPESPLCIGFYNASHGIVFDDLARMPNEWNINSFSVMIIRQTLATFAETLSSNKSRKVLWTHIAHSEAGLIANEILTTPGCYNLFRQYNGIDKFLKEHMITLTYGGVSPIPDVVHLAINNYSKDDITRHWFAYKYLDKLPKPITNDDIELKELARKIYRETHLSQSYSADEIYSELKTGSDKFFISKYPHESTKNGYTLTIIKSEVPKWKQPLIEMDHAFDSATYQNALKDNLKRLRKDFGIHDCR